MTPRIFLSAALIALAAPSLLAQQVPFSCRTNHPEVLEEIHHNDPAILEQMAHDKAELEAWTRSFSEGSRSDYVIPVVFHIIHNYGAENIDDEQIHDAMRILNEDFNKLNPDWPNVRPEFLNLVANVSIEFRLARKDPQGNCTKGITRTVSTLTNAGDQSMKNLIQWPRNKYLNIWVAASADGAAGYTLVPGDVNLAIAAPADGIVLEHSYVGSIGTGNASRSRALTHEVGHWINLEHTWGTSNSPGLAGNCSGSDFVSDTPPTIGWLTCNLNGATCGSALDNVENYMEYSYCSKMFTLGQKTRMIAALNSGTAQRNQLTTGGNLTFTGVDAPEALCAADFSSSQRIICAGGTVSYTDESYNAVTGWDWSFPGATPSSSSDENPTVTYAAPGVYPVTLTATDGSASLTNTQTNYITVLPDPGGPVPVLEGFETITTLNGPEWFVENLNADNTFGVTSVAAYSGSKSVRLVNTSAMAGRFDNLISSTYDMSGETSVVVSFRYAYAKRSSTSDDALRFYVSNNCGATWILRKILRGSTNLTTGGVSVTSFVPNGPAQWGFAEVTNITSTSLIPNFRFKFEFESDGGNNLYIDDININNAPLSTWELPTTSRGLVVMPNPTSDEARIYFALQRPGMVEVDVIDMTGRAVRMVHSGNLPAGEQRIDVNVDALPAGMYFVRLQQGAAREVGRFIVR